MKWEKLKPIVVLTAICVIVSAALVGTYGLTKPVIDAAKAAEANAALSAVLPDGTDFEEVTVSAENVLNAYKAGNGAGYVFQAQGKGFAGTIKRWGFKSYRRTHGSHKNERRPGSVGACATPSRILKGKRMAGRMGHVTATVQSLTVMSADAENNVLAIKGAIPGPKGGIVLVRTAVKGA